MNLHKQMKKLVVILILFFISGIYSHAQRSQFELGIRYLKLGETYRIAGMYEKSAEYLHKGREIAIKSRSKYWEAVAWEYLGYLYADMKQFDQARQYFTWAQEIYDDIIKMDNGSQDALRIASDKVIYKADLEDRIKQLEAEKNSLLDENNSQRSQIRDYQNRVSTLENRIKSLEADIDSLLATIKDIQSYQKPTPDETNEKDSVYKNYIFQIGPIVGIQYLLAPEVMTDPPTMALVNSDNHPVTVDKYGFTIAPVFGLEMKLRFGKWIKLSAFGNYSSFSSTTPVNIPDNSNIEPGDCEISYDWFNGGIGPAFFFPANTPDRITNFFIQPQFTFNYFIVDRTFNELKDSTTFFRMGAALSFGSEIRLSDWISLEFGACVSVPNLLEQNNDDPATPISEALVHKSGETEEEMIISTSLYISFLLDF